MTDKQIIIDGVDVRECACIIEDYYYQQANNLTNGYKHIKNVCELGESGSEHYNLFCKDNPNCYFKQLKRKEQECEELKKELQAQRAFTAHEQKLIYCVAYDETCKTGNDCKQKKCIFKDNIKLKQTLTEIKEIADKDFRHTAWEEYAKQLKQIIQKISECEVENEQRTKRTINGKIEYDIKSDMIAQEEKKKIKRSECPYGGIDCENCSDLDEDTVCAYKLKKVIKGIINKVKGETDEES